MCSKSLYVKIHTSCVIIHTKYRKSNPEGKGRNSPSGPSLDLQKRPRHMTTKTPAHSKAEPQPKGKKNVGSHRTRLGDTKDLARAQRLLGHKTRSMMEHYTRNRKGEKVSPEVSCYGALWGCAASDLIDLMNLSTCFLPRLVSEKIASSFGLIHTKPVLHNLFPSCFFSNAIRPWN